MATPTAREKQTEAWVRRTQPALKKQRSRRGAAALF